MPTFWTALGGFGVKFAVTMTGDRVLVFLFFFFQKAATSM